MWCGTSIRTKDDIFQSCSQNSSDSIACQTWVFFQFSEIWRNWNGHNLLIIEPISNILSALESWRNSLSRCAWPLSAICSNERAIGVWIWERKQIYNLQMEIYRGRGRNFFVKWRSNFTVDRIWSYHISNRRYRLGDQSGPFFVEIEWLSFPKWPPKGEKVVLYSEI